MAFTHSLERTDLFAGILAIIGGTLSYVVPSLTQWIGLGLWAIPLTFFAILVVTRLILAPYWIHRKIEAEKAQLQCKVDSLTAPRPSIKFVKPRLSPMFRPSPVVDAKIPAGKRIQAWFENRPMMPGDQSIAKQMSAILSFRRSGESEPIFEIHGQWAESTAPDHAGYSRTTSTIDLPPGALYAKLLIANKYPGEDIAYAYSAEGMQKHFDGRDPTRQFPPGDYQLEVQLRGINVDETHYFRLTNTGSAGDLHLAAEDYSP